MVVNKYVDPGATDLRCPTSRNTNCSGYLIEVAPGGFQCWKCLHMRRATMYTEIQRQGGFLKAFFCAYLPAAERYQVGEVSWAIDKWGYVSDVLLDKGGDIPLGEEAEFPLPIVLSPWPVTLPDGMWYWNPQWRAERLLGAKELAL